MSSGQELSNAAYMQLARWTLREFVRDKYWLSALAGEGNVFAAPDCEDAQLLRALDRFDVGHIKLLTSDSARLQAHPDKVVSPEQFSSSPIKAHRVDFIDLKTQQDRIRPQLEEGIRRILHHGQCILGPEVAEVERRLQDYTGTAYCITAASGTEALLITLMALGIGPGDEVITTPFIFVATAEVIVLVGAKPVFVDVEADTCNIDASNIDLGALREIQVLPSRDGSAERLRYMLNSLEGCALWVLDEAAQRLRRLVSVSPRWLPLPGLVRMTGDRVWR